MINLVYTNKFIIFIKIIFVINTLLASTLLIFCQYILSLLLIRDIFDLKIINTKKHYKSNLKKRTNILGSYREKQ